MNQPTCDLLITNAYIVTFDAYQSAFKFGFLAIKDEDIIALGHMDDIPQELIAKRVLDARENIVMPGLVNCHNHCAMTLFRGLADDLPLNTWLQDYIFPAESKFVTPEMVYWCTKLAAAEMLLSGTTTVADAYFYEEFAAQAFAHMGMRAIAAQGVIDYPAPGVPDPSLNLQAVKSFIERIAPYESIIKPAIFCHSPYTCGVQTLQNAKQLAIDHHIPFFIHVAETKDEYEQCVDQHSISPVGYLYNLGLMDANSIFVHNVWLDHNDYSLIEQTDVKIVTCPESNMKLASGVMSLLEMSDRKISIGIGTDGAASNNNLDMFAELGSCARLHKVVGNNPTVVDAGHMLDLATRGGAGVLSLQDECGSLEVGKKADLIMLKKTVGLSPFYTHDTLVYSSSAANVQTVIINGKIVVDDRKIVSEDVEEIQAKVREFSQLVLS